MWTTISVEADFSFRRAFEVLVPQIQISQELQSLPLILFVPENHLVILYFVFACDPANNRFTASRDDVRRLLDHDLVFRGTCEIRREDVEIGNYSPCSVIFAILSGLSPLFSGRRRKQARAAKIMLTDFRSDQTVSSSLWPSNPLSALVDNCASLLGNNERGGVPEWGLHSNKDVVQLDILFNFSSFTLQVSQVKQKHFYCLSFK